mmetsp:Transcript_34775/g.74162  ORF Transcript_34775/g.74162 Transcript_34775/m.74162 type:complete len:329 (-) Transcript_34775:71-1057(-)
MKASESVGRVRTELLELEEAVGIEVQRFPESRYVDVQVGPAAVASDGCERHDEVAIRVETPAPSTYLVAVSISQMLLEVDACLHSSPEHVLLPRADPLAYHGREALHMLSSLPRPRPQAVPRRHGTTLREHLQEVLLIPVLEVHFQLEETEVPDVAVLFEEHHVLRGHRAHVLHVDTAPELLELVVARLEAARPASPKKPLGLDTAYIIPVKGHQHLGGAAEGDLDPTLEAVHERRSLRVHLRQRQGLARLGAGGASKEDLHISGDDAQAGRGLAEWLEPHLEDAVGVSYSPPASQQAASALLGQRCGELRAPVPGCHRMTRRTSRWR